MDITVWNELIKSSPQVVGAVFIVYLFLRHIRATDQEQTEAQLKKDQTAVTLEMADDARYDKIGRAMEEIGRLIGQNTAAIQRNTEVLDRIDDYFQHGRAPVERVPHQRPRGQDREHD